MKKKKEKQEFSKILLIQESILIWIITLAFIVLAFVAISNDYIGELPWLAAMCACPWAAYGVSQACYYKKSEKENTKGGIKYETILSSLNSEFEEVSEEDEIVEEEFAPGDKI